MRIQEPREPAAPALVASPMAWQPLPERPRSPWRWVGLALMVTLALLVGSLFVHLPYYLESPGSAQSVTPLISVDPAHRHAVTGDVLLSTVALTSGVTPIQLVQGWLDPNVNVIERRDVTGGISNAQFAQLSALEMDQSKQDAIVVALRRLGYTVPEHGDGVLVSGVDSRAPAEAHLRPGDVIVAADTKTISIAQDLTAAIRSHHPRDIITLKVQRPNAGMLTETMPLISCPEDVPGCAGTNGQRPYLGITLQTRNDKFDYPFKVDIDLTGVGGPSAGLAFTLGVMDALTSGHLTGGHKVAVTGTIGLDGTVGPIGGIALKTVAVERAGADVFLVPKDDGTAGEPQYSAAAAKAKGHHLKVIAVGTLDDALNALRSMGGDLTGVPPAGSGTQG